MTFLDMPAWLQVALGLDALVVAALTARFGWRGLAAGLLGSLAFWLLLAFGGSWLVSRLEGSRPGVLSDLLPGAGQALVRLAAAAAPPMLAAALLGGLVRLRRRR